ncbi:MAG: hypothetical protein VX259_13465, partial [Pseudomonadota bacterium]|nr:hypothetical protein [Pseudomonadota bacterium]
AIRQWSRRWPLKKRCLNEPSTWQKREPRRKKLELEMAEWQGRCTTITPGMVNTPFFDQPKPDKLYPQDVADAVLYAIHAAPRANIREVHLMPTR